MAAELANRLLARLNPNSENLMAVLALVVSVAGSWDRIRAKVRAEVTVTFSRSLDFNGHVNRLVLSNHEPGVARDLEVSFEDAETGDPWTPIYRWQEIPILGSGDRCAYGLMIGLGSVTLIESTVSWRDWRKRTYTTTHNVASPPDYN